MRWHLLLAICMVILAGCNGIIGDDTTNPEPDESWRYSLVVQNGFAEPQEVTATLTTEGGQPIVDKTRPLESGERWVVTRLNESAHSGHEYSFTVSTAAEGQQMSNEFNTTAQEGVTYTSGATLYVIGRGAIHTCGGNATCYQEIDA